MSGADAYRRHWQTQNEEHTSTELVRGAISWPKETCRTLSWPILGTINPRALYQNASHGNEKQN